MKRSLCSLPYRISNSVEKQLFLRGRGQHLSRHSFHTSPRLQVLKPFILADIGEGIREVQIIQWFVQPGARVEQFDKICEVASDKAIVEITSRYDGVIKNLHYEADAMAQVGKALCDIDVQGQAVAADEVVATKATDAAHATERKPESSSTSVQGAPKTETAAQSKQAERPQSNGSKKSAHLATPAVRGLLKEHNLDITQINGTGRDGRVLKDDIHNHLNANGSTKSTTAAAEQRIPPQSISSISSIPQAETTVTMTPIQAAMFKAMTRSLSIPHFLYSDEVDMTELSQLRTTINSSLSTQQQLPAASQTTTPFSPPLNTPVHKVSYLPFIIKAISLALHKYPILNATLSPQPSANSNQNQSQPPKLLHRPSHNIGIAIDTPSGLLVPVIKNVQTLSFLEIAHSLSYLQSLAANNKLTSHPDLLSGGTLTVSNIGNIGGGVLSPVLVEGQSAILGIGKARELPRFGRGDTVERRLIAGFSWTADHRVLDGATVARFASEVAGYVQRPQGMVVAMR